MGTIRAGWKPLNPQQPTERPAPPAPWPEVPGGQTDASHTQSPAHRLKLLEQDMRRNPDQSTDCRGERTQAWTTAVPDFHTFQVTVTKPL